MCSFTASPTAFTKSERLEKLFLKDGAKGAMKEFYEGSGVGRTRAGFTNGRIGFPDIFVSSGDLAIATVPSICLTTRASW